MEFVDWLKSWRFGIAVVVLVVAFLGWNLLGLGEEVDIPRLEGEIRDEFANQFGGAPSDYDAGCPTSVEWKTGQDFRCVVESATGERTRVTVYMESDDGSYTWAVE